jgi:hypothetical protein
VPSNSTSFSVVDLESNLRPNLSTLDIEEAEGISLSILLDGSGLLDIMRSCVNNREEEHGICNLSMEPLRLIKR